MEFENYFDAFERKNDIWNCQRNCIRFWFVELPLDHLRFECPQWIVGNETIGFVDRSVSVICVAHN